MRGSSSTRFEKRSSRNACRRSSFSRSSTRRRKPCRPSRSTRKAAKLSESLAKAQTDLAIAKQAMDIRAAEDESRRGAADQKIQEAETLALEAIGERDKLAAEVEAARKQTAEATAAADARASAA